MTSRNQRGRGRVFVPCTVLGSCLAFSACLAFSGSTEVVYRGSSPKRTYDVNITMHAGPSEKMSWWSMDVLRNKKPLLAGYYFSPFYAWTCVNRGRAAWSSDSVLQFMNLSCQGRRVGVTVRNASGTPIRYVEVWMRSVDAQGYPHSPSISLLFDVPDDTESAFHSEIFPGEYFLIRCEVEGRAAVSRFKIPTKRGAPHDIAIRQGHRLRITLTKDGPAIKGGAFESLSEQQSKAMVPGGVRLHLIEQRRDHRRTAKTPVSPSSAPD